MHRISSSVLGAVERLSALPPARQSAYYSTTRGRLASTGLMKESQRAQVQSPGKTVWNDSTANTELALAA
jgi:hypothetical protein